MDHLNCISWSRSHLPKAKSIDLIKATASSFLGQLVLDSQKNVSKPPCISSEKLGIEDRESPGRHEDARAVCSVWLCGFLLLAQLLAQGRAGKPGVGSSAGDSSNVNWSEVIICHGMSEMFLKLPLKRGRNAQCSFKKCLRKKQI